MKAIILAGGEATRLRPLTCNTPKAMIPVLNTPFLEWVITYLRSHGIREFIIAGGYLFRPIQEHFGDGEGLGVNIEYFLETEPLGTAGGIKNAAHHVRDTFLALNGDIFQDFDVSALIEFHRRNKAKATIALTPVEDPTQYGLIETDSDMHVTRFLEKPSRDQITTDKINAGIYVLEPEVLDIIPPGVKVSIERETFPRLVQAGERVFACPGTGYWMDTGTPEKYLQLQRDLLAGRSRLFSPPASKKASIGGGCVIHPTAQIVGPVIIGKNCRIGERVRIKGPAIIGNSCMILADSTIEDSMLWHSVRLGPKAWVQCSIVGNACLLDDESALQSSVLGDNVVIPAGCSPEPGTKIWPGERYKLDK